MKLTFSNFLIFLLLTCNEARRLMRIKPVELEKEEERHIQSNFSFVSFYKHLSSGKQFVVKILKKQNGRLNLNELTAFLAVNPRQCFLKVTLSDNWLKKESRATTQVSRLDKSASNIMLSFCTSVKNGKLTYTENSKCSEINFKKLEELQKESPIINIYSFGIKLGHFFIVMPRMTGNLSDFANDLEVVKLQLIYQTAIRLKELHSLNLIHRDIKPENILVDRRNKELFVHIGDLGSIIRNEPKNMTEISGTDIFLTSNKNFRNTVHQDYYALAVTALVTLNKYLRFKFEVSCTRRILPKNIENNLNNEQLNEIIVQLKCLLFNSVEKEHAQCFENLLVELMKVSKLPEGFKFYKRKSSCEPNAFIADDAFLKAISID